MRSAFGQRRIPPVAAPLAVVVSTLVAVAAIVITGSEGGEDQAIVADGTTSTTVAPEDRRVTSSTSTTGDGTEQSSKLPVVEPVDVDVDVDAETTDSDPDPDSDSDSDSVTTDRPISTDGDGATAGNGGEPTATTSGAETTARRGTTSTGPTSDVPRATEGARPPPTARPTTAVTSATTVRNIPAAQPGDRNDAYFGGGTPRCQIFPGDNWWNSSVNDLPVHPQSGAWVSSVGSGNLHPAFGTVWQGKAIGVPFRIVGGDQPKVPVDFTFSSQSEPGPYPIPPDAPIEDFPDRHVVIIDDDNCKLYELFDAAPKSNGHGWDATSGAVFDLRSNSLRPDGWTSADAAGLPIYPGLVTYEEVVEQGRIDHALRFTSSRTQRAYIRPATHFASTITDPNVPPLGARFRMKASYDCSGFSQEVQVICTAMKTYGMFLADNGVDWTVVGAPDPRWDDLALRDLKSIPGSAFEVVDTGEPLTR